MALRFDELKDILVQDMKVTPDLVTPDATWEDMELDSLAMVELSLMLEQRFGLAVSDDQLLEAATIGDMVELLAQRSGAA
ncbi:hypothetical protein GCM10027168_49780 [Streptomyces capparidis]|jgi:acyl carrier protein